MLVQGVSFDYDHGTTTITVHTVPEGIQPKSKVTAAWFLQKNCKVQGTALLKSLQNS